MKYVVLDFETNPIRTRPHYPPKPVSFSLQLPSWRKPKFFAWGHHTGGNNTSFEDAKRALTAAYELLGPQCHIICQNGKFDLDVAEVHFGLPLPYWEYCEDTMFLLFLHDPHQRELGLKPSAERLLGMPPEEQDAVKDWLLTHKKQLETDFPEIVRDHGGIKPSTVGAFIAYAPGNVVAPYADGDVTRTLGIFNHVYPLVCDAGMGPAYAREKQLMPILLRNEREGIRVDESALHRDLEVFEAAQAKTDAWIRKHLKTPDLDLNKDAEMAAALKAADAISEWTQTATGRDSVSRKNMKLEHFVDQRLAAAYGYRQKCATVLETFIRPWLQHSTDGRMSTTWHQTRGGDGGTRTGRPSTSHPNFLNMPKEMKDSLGFKMPTHIKDLPSLPKIRSYILPDRKGHVIGRRDYSQQELRVLAHFEDGALMEAYLANPNLDVHEFLRQQIKELLGMDVDRSITKTLNFGFLYGMGLGSLAMSMNKTVEEVKVFRQAQLKALPGLKVLNQSIMERAKQGLPIRTWGGREYYAEPPAFSKKFNKVMTFEYKLINYAIQSSSADITKEAIIRYDAARKDGRFLLSVYDEIDISMPQKALKSEMLILRDCMMSIELDVPLMSDGEWGLNLGTLEDLKEPKPDLSRWGIAKW